MLLQPHYQRSSWLYKRSNATRVAAAGTLYNILGVTSTASQEEIRAAYKQQVHKLHPDKHLQEQVDTTAAFIKCKVAYEILINKRKRRQYDQQHLSGRQQQNLNAQEETDTGSPKHSSQWSESDPTVASAAVAAAAGSSSFTQSVPGAAAADAMRRQPSPDHAPPSPTRPKSLVLSSSAVRIGLMTHHDVVLEQFQSLQEALDFLQQLEQQQELLGLAVDDYTVLEGSSIDSRVAHCTDGNDEAQRWGGFHPGEYAPIRHQ